VWTGMSTTQSLQRRSGTSLIKNAHIKSQVPSTAGRAAAWTILFIRSADLAAARNLMGCDRILEATGLTIDPR
jgi:hypothetical protein